MSKQGEAADSEMLARASGERDALAAAAAAACRAARAGGCRRARRHRAESRRGRVTNRATAASRAGYTVVVEGAGGVMVPLAWDYTVLDLARRPAISTPSSWRARASARSITWR